jgi:hypothetical protein
MRKKCDWVDVYVLLSIIPLGYAYEDRLFPEKL